MIHVLSFITFSVHFSGRITKLFSYGVDGSLVNDVEKLTKFECGSC